MRRLFALVLAVCLWVGFVPSASADIGGLVPCRESQEFLQRAQKARPTTPTTDPQDRFERYADALCGPEGLPHLIVDGRLDHAGDFLIPGILFLYIAGWIGWVGRAYLQAVKKESNTEENEIIINVPLALPIMLSGFAWPLSAVKEFLTGELVAKDEEIPVSPR